jgi:hypothetical protein
MLRMYRPWVFVDSNYILRLYHLFRCETVTDLFYSTIQGVPWAVLARTIDFLFVLNTQVCHSQHKSALFEKLRPLSAGYSQISNVTISLTTLIT